ncbi:MAG: hypothetical protein HOC41_05625 [Candidatus Marinimicrobia bacterium]|jgi:hypothetical protein|nr:hypothetical protein [Candidatus Neomarinimicrobiota bacterium]MBT3945102.1 hypothetical protein [Candidatus Neomarinimicrobiota bacterium]MBT4154923.1 hypothetical protein [Candidatus Neomarinimicrobiota bacterium]MBT4555144.1 hypothetical protein [Candidatus Neomarinimicrobiota bacterium]MBT4752236.1 hypothetical protein [Candidatus Neomarinimicrobiota bacterium]|tara:strand:+ start:7625 stop:7816 length:192 start_codon:yes stop_codon:yes gene_type:complete
MSFRHPKFLQNWLKLYRDGGFLYLLKEKGFVVLVSFFLFYLIRDSILYIVIPYLAYSNISSCS